MKPLKLNDDEIRRACYNLCELLGEDPEAYSGQHETENITLKDEFIELAKDPNIHLGPDYFEWDTVPMPMWKTHIDEIKRHNLIEVAMSMEGVVR